MSNSISIHNLADMNEVERRALFRRVESDLSEYHERVATIIEAVKREGDKALVRFARTFDRSPIEADTIQVRDKEFGTAFDVVDRKLIDALEFAAQSIRTFHEAQKPGEMWLKEVRPGVFGGDRFTPIPSVACYAPRGKGVFPTSVLMSALPALVAGVPDICLLTPSGPDGEVDAATLVAARIAGIDTVYKAGGAVAVAAAAFGTETVRRCAKIVGPGSPWFSAAKRVLADVIDTGPPAGPSEAIVFADETVDGRLAALDLLIESEHGPDSSALLVTCSKRVADEAMVGIETFWNRLGPKRREFSKTVLSGSHGGIVLAPDLEVAIAFINEFAPEHLEILSREPFRYLGLIKNAGEILLGQHTPITVGNFSLGVNHVLPTNGMAATRSPLSVFDFLKCTSIGYVTPPGYEAVREAAHILASYEGFEAHANAVSALRDELLR